VKLVSSALLQWTRHDSDTCLVLNMCPHRSVFNSKNIGHKPYPICKISYM